MSEKARPFQEREIDKTLSQGERAVLTSGSLAAYEIKEGEGFVLYVRTAVDGKGGHGPMQPVHAGNLIKTDEKLTAILSNHGATPLVYCALPVVKVPAE